MLILISTILFLISCFFIAHTVDPFKSPRYPWREAYRCKGCGYGKTNGKIDFPVTNPANSDTLHVICQYCGSYFYGTLKVGRKQNSTHIWEWKEDLDQAAAKSKQDEESLLTDINLVASKCEIDPEYKIKLLAKLQIQNPQEKL